MWAVMGNRLMLSGLFPIVIILPVTLVAYVIFTKWPQTYERIMYGTAVIDVIVSILFITLLLLNAFGIVTLDWTPANIVGTCDILGVMFIICIALLFQKQNRCNIDEILANPSAYRHLVSYFQRECCFLQTLAFLTLCIWCLAFWHLTPDTVLPSNSYFGLVLTVLMVFFSCECSIEYISMQTNMGKRKIDPVLICIVVAALCYHIAFMVGTIYALQMNIVVKVLRNNHMNVD